MKQIFFPTEETLLTTGYYGIVKYENSECITLKDRYLSLDDAKQAAHKYNKELAEDDRTFNIE